mgnify:CR=1 FL=1
MVVFHSTKHIIHLWHIVVFFLQFHICALNTVKRLHEKKKKGLFRLSIDTTNLTKTQIPNLRFANCIINGYLIRKACHGIHEYRGIA